MRLFILFWIGLTGCLSLFYADASATAVQQSAKIDTSVTLIPIYLQLWHDRITRAQQEADSLDGKMDNTIELSKDPSLNKEITHALINRVDQMRSEIEGASMDRRHKVLYLNSIYGMVHKFNIQYQQGKLKDKEAVTLVDNFSKMMAADRKGKSIAELAKHVPYAVGAINVSLFTQNYGYNKARTYLLHEYGKEHPESFLNTLDQYYSDLVNEPFVDTEVAKIARIYPVKVYNYATSYTALGKVIRNNPDTVVQAITKIGSSPKAIRLLPFVDYIVDGTYTIPKLEKIAGDDDAYYQLSVKTLIDMNKRKLVGDHPIGRKSMEFNVRKRAMRYIRIVNELHESSDNTRFAIANRLTPQEIYYVLVNGQEEIYTSSFVGLYGRMMQRMDPPKGDQFLVSLVFDHFRKFITLSAAYNTLNPFLQTMKPENASILMRKFVSGLQNSEGLEDAVDVADAFGSIKDTVLLEKLQKQVNQNFQEMVQTNDERGKVIYGLLATLFNSRNTSNKADIWATNMAKKLNLPPLDYIPFKALTSSDGKVYEEVLFYGDKDGFASFRSFMTSFRNSDWHVSSEKYWVKITSTRGKPIVIFAKKPMQTEDEEAMNAMQAYLKKHNIKPTVFIHRGHSYHVKSSIEELKNSAKLVMLGSCGGYNSLASVLNVAPDAQIITSKQTGAMGVNEPIIRAIERNIREGKDLKWETIWSHLSRLFKSSPHYDELFQDYIPPQENLGAVFIKAYKKLMNEKAPIDTAQVNEDATLGAASQD